MTGWTRIPNAMVERIGEVGHATFAVYVAIAMHADDTGKCWPSVTRLTEIVRCSRKTVLNAIKKLEAAGDLKVGRTPRGKAAKGKNQYTLPPHEDSEATKPTMRPDGEPTKPTLVSSVPEVGFAGELEQDSRTRQEQEPVSPEPEVQAVLDHYRTHHPKARLELKSKEAGKIRARLKDGFTVEQLKAAIDGNHRSPFHCGKNDRGTEYYSLDLILRDHAKVEFFLSVPAAKPAPNGKPNNKPHIFTPGGSPDAPVR